MSSRSQADRACAIPLLDMANSDNHLLSGLSDEEIEDFSLEPMDGLLRSVLPRPRNISRLQCITSAAFFSFLSFVFAFLLAYIFYSILYPPNCVHRRATTPAGQSISSHIKPDSIRDYLWALTRKPHIAGSEQQLELALYLKEEWMKNGIEDVKLVPYDVLLSFANRSNPNEIQIFDNNEKKPVVRMVGVQPPIFSPEERNGNVTASFNAYSATKRLLGDLVYVNYGDKSDFELLENSKINLSESIVLARYGKSFRSNIVKRAEKYGASGVILYSDPADYAAEGRTKVYPFAYWLPDTGVQSGTVMMGNGDPSTPNYPSVAGAYRVSDDKLNLPKIPVQPISYGDAEKLLREMDGRDAPPEWTGGLNISYKIGRGFKNSTLKTVLDVKTHNVMAVIYNVIGIIPGFEEPDRYVILGNHRDAWTFGAIDPSGGTAVLTEITSAVGKLLGAGWKPRRTLVFCSWGAEEYGVVGSWEWMETKAKLLQERAVAYLNVDVAVDGNYTLKVRASPSLYDVVYSAAEKVPNPNPTEVAHGRESVYDTWLYTSFNETTPPSGSYPKIDALGSGSDYSGFIYVTGVPSLDLTYFPNEKIYKFSNPLYHSLYETFYAVNNLTDPGFHYHASVAMVWSEVAKRLCDAVVLPFNFVTYAAKLQDGFDAFSTKYRDELVQQEISLDDLGMTIKNFSIAAMQFNASIAKMDNQNQLTTRMMNDRIMQVERAFIAPEGIPLSPQYRHVLLATSIDDEYSGEYFPGLVNLISSSDKSRDQWELFKQHLSAISYYINSASAVLSDDL